MTRRDELDHVLDGIDAAQEAGFDPVKINTVVQRGVNDDEIVDLAAFGRRARRRGALHRVHAARRVGSAGPTAPVVGQDEIVARIDAVFPLEQLPARGAAPADRWRYLDGGGTVGVIPSVTKPFCGDCDRVRLTADGQFRTCLFATDEYRPAARRCAPARPTTSWRAASSAPSARKWAGHQINQVDFVRPQALDEPDRRLTGSELGPPAGARLRAMSDLSFTHLDPLGRARMVDVTPKEPTHRRAVARCKVIMKPETTAAIANREVKKGDVLAVARVAGIQAAKRTSDMIPLCHPLLVGSVSVNFEIGDDFVAVEAHVDTVDRTGVEMEALHACATAALTVYDMCKSADRGMVIGELALWEKTGGRSGNYRRAGALDDVDGDSSR